MIQPKASASEMVTAFQLVMVPPFRRGEKHEARQADSALARLALCSGRHYAAGGGVSSLPRFFLLKNQKNSRGMRNTAASFQRPMPSKPTAASCRTGFMTKSMEKGTMPTTRE